MTGFKLLSFGYLFFAFATLEPLAIPAVLLGSAVAGGIGGWVSARRAAANAEDVTTHIVSMALLGTAVAMAGFGYFGTNTQATWFLIPVSIGCGLAGMPLVDSLVEGTKIIVETSIQFVINKIKRSDDEK